LSAEKGNSKTEKPKKITNEKGGGTKNHEIFGREKKVKEEEMRREIRNTI